MTSLLQDWNSWRNHRQNENYKGLQTCHPQEGLWGQWSVLIILWGLCKLAEVMMCPVQYNALTITNITNWVGQVNEWNHNSHQENWLHQSRQELWKAFTFRFCLVLFWILVLPGIPGSSGTCLVAQAGLEPIILQSVSGWKCSTTPDLVSTCFFPFSLLCN